MSRLAEDIFVHVVVCMVWTAFFLVGLVSATAGIVGLAWRLGAPLGEYMDSGALDFLFSPLYWAIALGVSAFAGIAIPTGRERQRLRSTRALAETEEESVYVPWATVHNSEDQGKEDQSHG
jgi:hypothetical protein